LFHAERIWPKRSNGKEEKVAQLKAEKDEDDLHDQHRAWLGLVYAFQVFVDEHQQNTEHKAAHHWDVSLYLNEVNVGHTAAEGQRHLKLEVKHTRRGVCNLSFCLSKIKEAVVLEKIALEHEDSDNEDSID
jgi:hypothetical protein